MQSPLLLLLPSHQSANQSARPRTLAAAAAAAVFQQCVPGHCTFLQCIFLGHLFTSPSSPPVGWNLSALKKVGTTAAVIDLSLSFSLPSDGLVATITDQTEPPRQWVAVSVSPPEQTHSFRPSACLPACLVCRANVICDGGVPFVPSVFIRLHSFVYSALISPPFTICFSACVHVLTEWSSSPLAEL